MANLRANNLTGTGGRNAIDGSLCFDGSGANEVGYPGLALADSDDWHFDGDFTMEGWIKRGKTVPTAAGIVGQWESSGGTDRNAMVYLNNQNKLIAYQNRSTTNYSVISASTLEQGVWYHFAFVLQGSNLRLYMNGVQTQTTSVSGTQNNSTATFFVASEANSNNAGTYSFSGCLSNIRVIKGTALYEDGTTFTPPTEKLTAIPGTVLLCCQDSKDATQEATGKTIVPVGGRLPSGNNTIVQNGDFSAGTHAWFGDSGASISASGGVATVTNGGGDNLYAIKQQGVFTTGRRYRVTGTVNATFSGDSIFRVRAGGSAVSWSITNKLTSGTAYYFDTGTITADGSPLEIGSGGDGSSSTITQFTLQDVKVYAEDLNPGDNNLPPVGVDEGVVFDGPIKINTQGVMYFPTGDTSQRGRGRGAFAMTAVYPNANSSISYIDIATQGTAKDFGDLTAAGRYGCGNSSATRGVSGGALGRLTTMDYVTLATTGNAVSFGTLTYNNWGQASVANSTRIIWISGNNPNSSPESNINTMTYITTATTGNGTDFGDYTDGEKARYIGGNISSPTRGLAFGGYHDPNYTSNIDYVTIGTTGNSQDFGDLSVANSGCPGCSDSTRGVIFGGYTAPASVNSIDMVTIATTGTATDFGDIPTATKYGAACSNSIRGVHLAGGYPAADNSMSYVTIQTTGNAQDFGDLPSGETGGDSCENNNFADSHGGLS